MTLHAQSSTTPPSSIFPPLHAQALYALATIGRVTPARQREVLHAAAIAGARAGDDHLVASAWTDLVLVIGYNEGRQHEALSLEPFARAAVARAGDDPILEADLLNSVGIVLDELGRNGEAQRAFERSLALRENVLGENHSLVAASLNNLGDSLRLSGDLALARTSSKDRCGSNGPCWVHITEISPTPRKTSPPYSSSSVSYGRRGKTPSWPSSCMRSICPSSRGR